MTAQLNRRALILAAVSAAALFFGVLIVDSFFAVNRPRELHQNRAVRNHAQPIKIDPLEPSPFWD
jgi:hypothetical protein